MRYLPVPGGRTRIRVVVAAPGPTQPAHQDQPGAATVLQVTPAPTLANHPPTVTTRIRGCPHQRPTTAPLSPSAPSPVPPQVNECDSLPERSQYSATFIGFAASRPEPDMREMCHFGAE